MRPGTRAEGMNPSQERVVAYATQGLSWGSGRPARVPLTLVGLAGFSHLVSPPPTPVPLSALLTSAPSLQLVPFPPALAWMDQRVREGMGSSLRELAGGGEFQGWPGIPQSAPRFGTRASSTGFLEDPLPPPSPLGGGGVVGSEME